MDGKTAGKSFSARPHGKKPSYFDAAEKSLKVTIDGKPNTLVMHPKKETGNRVNFTVRENEWLFVDSDELAALVKGGGKLVFTTAHGRVAKEVEAKPEAKGAKAPATSNVDKPITAPAAKPATPAELYQKPMGKAAIAAAQSAK